MYVHFANQHGTHVKYIYLCQSQLSINVLMMKQNFIESSNRQILVMFWLTHHILHLNTSKAGYASYITNKTVFLFSSTHCCDGFSNTCHQSRPQRVDQYFMFSESKVKQQHGIFRMKIAKHGCVRCTTKKQHPMSHNF